MYISILTVFQVAAKRPGVRPMRVDILRDSGRTPAANNAAAWKAKGIDEDCAYRTT
ncbi:hypothetical protein [Candidatus Regiella insecticola]|uniref:hypothetical protein n=1 Tax=Candidatus Regiella insecticola TaxID=138073 RepID=UPI00031D6496|nr:hypothetical protein [Candidatus Regiella insecticola]